MVRTRADGAGSKAVGAKAPRKNVGASSSGGCSSASSSPSSNKNKSAGGNPACPRPVPDWQKGIQHFFVNKENTSPNKNDGESTEDCGSKDAECAGASKDATRKRVSPISDDDSD